MNNSHQNPYFGSAIGLLVMGVAVFGLVLISALATGSTFGQRCEKAFPDNKIEWRACVDRLVAGGDV